MPDSPALRGLLAMRELLSDPSRWTKGAAARNARGNRVPPRSRSAICWCLYGAYEHSAEAGATLALAFALDGQLPPKVSVRAFNDDPTTTHADILALLDRAIAAQRSAP